MRRRSLAWIVLASFAAIAACSRNEDATPPNTSVMGGTRGEGASAQAPPTNAADALPSPPVAKGTSVQLTMVDPKTGLALWEQDGRIMVARYTNNTKWQKPHPLEQILGKASNATLASNGRGVAVAVWQHTVGEIESLRYSRYEAATGWSKPDVMPGALPQPDDSKFSALQRRPRVEVDAMGNVRAEWRSGFDPEQVQASTYVPGEGWAHPVDLPAPGMTAKAP